MKISDYKKIESRFSNKRILVIGDLILDNYLWGMADRISPEAPVPVVKIESTSSNVGGAGNVAANLRSLGANVDVVGSAGDDRDGVKLKTLLSEMGTDISGIVVDPSKPTSVKTRVFAHNQQVVRADWEDTSSLDSEINHRIFTQVEERIKDTDAVILQDYDKGLFTSQLLSQIISLCSDNSTPVYADPKFDHFFDLKNVTLLKPNLNEMNRAMGNTIITDSQMNDQGQKLREKLQCDLLLLTLGAKGMTLFDESGVHSIPTRARNVHDVSGAGDTVIAAFALAHICESSPEEAAAIANYAAGSVVEQAGVVTVTKEDLHNIISHHNPD